MAETSAPAAAAATSARQPFTAPVKPEFIIPTQPGPERPNANADAPAPVAENVAPIDTSRKHAREESPQRASNKRGRGGAKSKSFGERRREARGAPQDQICNDIAFGRQCPRGDGCRFSHDVKAYLASKPEDLGDRCPMFDAYGRCPMGVKCRFGRAHSDPETGAQIKIEGKEDQNVQILNGNTMPLQKDVRKGIKKLTRAAEVEAVLGKERGQKKGGADNAGKDKVGDGSASEAVESQTAAAPAKPDAEQADEIDVREGRLRPQEKKRIDFRDKLYLAPLTTVGNLPFRRICKNLGADVTCSEMVVALKLVQNEKNEFALLKRHKSEDVFGVQICGNNVAVMAKAAEILSAEDYGVHVDFIDINMGCPIDMVFNSGAGSALLERAQRLGDVVRAVDYSSIHPTTCKIRTGVLSSKPVAHHLLPLFEKWNVNLLTLHGRSREQRYSKLADWDYIAKVSQTRTPDSNMFFFGNGDVLSHEDYYADRAKANVDGIMLGRGALIKPWLFTEIKERRVWDISSRERFDILQDFAKYGLEYWGSDNRGIETTRRFLLECQSFFYRYIPAGLLEVLPQKMTERPPRYFGRDELETLMASPNKDDWLKLVERIPLLGKTPEGFQ